MKKSMIGSLYSQAKTSILMLKKILYSYKKQSKMGKGYLQWTKVLGSLRFIPKKPQRIEELSMIMV